MNVQAALFHTVKADGDIKQQNRQSNKRIPYDLCTIIKDFWSKLRDINVQKCKALQNVCLSNEKQLKFCLIPYTKAL